jgi:hypothetical protein
MGGACSTYGELRSANMVLVGRAKGKRPFGRPRLRWEGNINHLTPNGHFSGRTAPLTYRCCIFNLFNKYTY